MGDVSGRTHPHERFHQKKYFCDRKGSRMTFYKVLVKYHIKSFAHFWTPFFKIGCTGKLLRWPERWKIYFMERNSLGIFFFLVKWSLRELVCILEINTKEKNDLSKKTMFAKEETSINSLWLNICIGYQNVSKYERNEYWKDYELHYFMKSFGTAGHTVYKKMSAAQRDLWSLHEVELYLLASSSSL